MKIISLISMILAAVGLVMGAILRIQPRTLNHIPPRSFLAFAIGCLLFSIAASVYTIAKK